MGKVEKIRHLALKDLEFLCIKTDWYTNNSELNY